MRDRRRVLHVLPDLARGGGQMVVRHLVANRDRDRFDVHLACLRPPDAMRSAFRELGVEPILLEPRAMSLAAAFELARHIRHLDIDVVHVHSDPDRKVGQMAALLTRRPVIGHLHSPWAHLEPFRAADSGRVTVALSTAKATARRSVEHHVVRHYLAAGAEVAAFHVGRVDAPIAIVANGIDTEEFRPRSHFERRRTRRSLGLADGPLLVCTGRLAGGKGQDALVSMVASVPGAHLLLVGEGDERPAIERLALVAGIADRVHLVGDRDDVADLVAAADLFVLASVSEGLPLSVLEAMACGVPVVAYDLPGLRSVILDGADGRLVAVGDEGSFVAAIRELLADDLRRAQLGQAARDRATRCFDARDMARSTEAVYDLVLGDDPLESRRHDGLGLTASR